MNKQDNEQKIGRAGHVGHAGNSWVTTALLIVVVLVLGRVGMVFDSPAMAEMAVNENGYTMLTTNGGSDEILVVVDSSAESVLVYRIGQSGGLDLLERELLSEVFIRARAQAMGGP